MSYYAAYLRDSGGEEQELSIEQQEKEIRAWCADRNYTLSAIFKDEARPGSSTVTRTAFQEMMHHFRTGQCQEQGVIIWKFSRFARDIDDAQFYKADLRRRGYEILSMKDSVPDGLDGRFFESAIDWMNARFLEDLSTDVKRGLKHLVSEYGGVPGTPPRGFKREPIHIGTHRDGKPHIVHKWVPDPETWDRCKLAWEMRASGASYNAIREATGNLYTTNSGLKHFFENPIYMGTLKYGDQVIENYTPALVDKKTWDRVQKINQARSIKNMPANIENPNHPRRENTTYLLSGQVRCAQCGALMNGSTNVHRKKGLTYHYYECTSASLNRDCQARKVPRHTLEKAVMDAMMEYLGTPEQVTQLLNQKKEIRKTDTADVDTKKAQISKELRSLKSRIHHLVEAIADGRSSKAILDTLAKHEARQAQLESQLIHYQHISLDVSEIKINDYVKLVTKALHLADRKEQRIVLKGLIDHIIVERDGGKIAGVIHFILPELTPISTSHRGGSYYRRETHPVPFEHPILITYVNHHTGKKKFIKSLQ